MKPKTGYNISREPFTKELYDEAYPLLIRHWEEVAGEKVEINLNPNYEIYRTLAEDDLLVCIVCREVNTGRMVGYSVSFLTPHIHYKDHMYGENDIIFIDKEYRKGMMGIKLLKENERILRDLGCSIIHLHVKTKHNFGPIMERLGYYPSETIYRKYVG